MSKPSRTTNPSSFKFKNRGCMDRNWSMQSLLLPFLFVFSSPWEWLFRSCWHWQTLLLLKSIVKPPQGLNLTVDTDSTYQGLWKLLPSASFKICTGSRGGNFHIQQLSYMTFHIQAMQFENRYGHSTNIHRPRALARLQFKLIREAVCLPFRLITF